MFRKFGINECSLSTDQHHSTYGHHFHLHIIIRLLLAKALVCTYRLSGHYPRIILWHIISLLMRIISSIGSQPA